MSTPDPTPTSAQASGSSSSQLSTLNSQLPAPSALPTLHFASHLTRAAQHLRAALDSLDSTGLAQTHFLRRRLTASFAEVGDLNRAVARESESEHLLAHALTEPTLHQLPPILQLAELFVLIAKAPTDEIARQITNPRFALREAAQTLLHLQQQLQRTEPAEPSTAQSERSAA